MFFGSVLVTVIQLGNMLLQHVPRFFPPISRSFEFSLSSFVHLFFQCLCFNNEYGSVSLCIRFIQWKTADDQDEQILNLPKEIFTS